MSHLDWPGMLRVGLRGLGLHPTEFWALTPVELIILLGADGGGDAALGRARLDELIRQFPDRMEEASNE